MQTSIICSVCSDGQMVTDPESGEIICRNCGIVMLDKIQESRPEWRAFTTDDGNDRSRTGTPSSLARHDMGLSTVIGRADKDASGNTFNYSTTGWQTVTIPLSMFLTNNGTGTAASSLTELLGSSGSGSVNIWLINNSPAATATGTNAAFDNIRVVKIN